MNGGTIRRVTGWRISKMTGTGTIRKIVRSEWYDNESAYLVCVSCRLESKFESAEQKIK